MSVAIFLRLPCATSHNPNSNHGNKFEQLGTICPLQWIQNGKWRTGPKYWHQRADYDIKCELDEKNLKFERDERSPILITLRMFWHICGSRWIKRTQQCHSANYQTSSQNAANAAWKTCPAKLGDDDIWRQERQTMVMDLISKLTRNWQRLWSMFLTRLWCVWPSGAVKAGQVHRKDCWNYKISDALPSWPGWIRTFPWRWEPSFTMASILVVCVTVTQSGKSAVHRKRILR